MSHQCYTADGVLTAYQSCYEVRDRLIRGSWIFDVFILKVRGLTDMWIALYAVIHSIFFSCRILCSLLFCLPVLRCYVLNKDEYYVSKTHTSLGNRLFTVVGVTMSLQQTTSTPVNEWRDDWQSATMVNQTLLSADHQTLTFLISCGSYWTDCRQDKVTVDSQLSWFTRSYCQRQIQLADHQTLTFLTSCGSY